MANVTKYKIYESVSSSKHTQTANSGKQHSPAIIGGAFKSFILCVFFSSFFLCSYRFTPLYAAFLFPFCALLVLVQSSFFIIVIYERTSWTRYIFTRLNIIIISDHNFFLFYVCLFAVHNANKEKERDRKRVQKKKKNPGVKCKDCGMGERDMKR